MDTTNDRTYNRFCCKKRCEGDCVTEENRRFKKLVYKKASEKKAFQALKVEKTRFLKAFEQNKRRRDVYFRTEGVLDSVSNLIEMPKNINITLDSIKIAFDKIIEVVNSITSSVVFPRAFDLLSFVISSYGLVTAVMRRDVLNSTMNLYLLSKVVSVNYDTVYSLIAHACGLDTTPVLPSAESLFSMIGSNSIILGIGNIFVILLSLMASPAACDIGGIMKSLADFGRTAIGFSKVSELTDYFFKFAKNLYYQHVVGKTLEQVEFEKAFPQLELILERIAMLKSPEFKVKFLDTNKHLCDKVVQLENDIETIRFDAMRARRNEIVAFLNSRSVSLRTTFEAARNSPAHSYASRPAPTTLWVYGKAETGKSNLVNYLKTHIFSKKYSNSPHWTLQNFSLTRCAENEYWDGYHDNPMVLYDDMCQSKDSAANPNPEIMEFIRAKNEAPYHLHMSSVADKKNTYFTSEYIIATSNVPYPSPTSIADPMAFQRRWDMCIEVKVNPLFGKLRNEMYVIDAAKVAAHIATTGCGAFVKEIYLIRVYDMITKNCILDNLTLSQFLDYYDKESVKTLATASSLNDSILALTGLTIPVKNEDAVDFATRFLAEGKEASNGSVKEPEVEVPDVEKVSSRELALSIMESQILESQHRETEKFCDALEIESPWLDFKVLEDCKESAERYYNVIKMQCKDTWKQWYTNYASLLNFSNIVNATTTIAQDIFRALYELMTTRNVVIGGFILMISNIIMEFAAYFFTQGLCNILCADTFEKLRGTAICVRDCTFCTALKLTKILGSVGYGMLLLDAIVKSDPTQASRCASWRNENFALYEEEITIAVIDKTMTLSDKIILATQSREITTRSSPASLRVESRETMTRSSLPKIRTESREIMTRGPAQNLRTECAIYNSEGASLKLVAEKRDLVMLEQWESVCAKNVVLCTATTVMAGTFVSGRTIMIPMHFVPGMHEKGYFTYQNPGADVGTKVITSTCAITQATSVTGGYIDLAFITIPASPSRRNIVNMFATANELPKVPEGDFVITTLRQLNKNVCITNFYGGNLVYAGSQLYNDDGKVRKMNTSFMYNVDTRPGDCGGLVYARNALVSGKIIGIHVAGHEGRGIALPLSREFIKRNLDEHMEKHSLPTSAVVDARFPFQSESFTAEMTKPVIDYNAVVVNSLTMVGNCIGLGRTAAPFAASKTNIVPSLLAGVIQTPDTKPAHLRSVLVDEVWVDPMIRGVTKVLNSPDALDPELLDMCVSDVKWIHSLNSKRGRVYTYEEAIVGIESNSFATPLNRTSSPGYPYCLDNSEPGKRKWFGYEDYVINKDIERDVKELIDYAKANKRGDVVWLATLKDERRPIAKVDAVKTRVFAAGPMHYTIAVRQYFLDFVTHVMENRIINEIGVGSNPYGLDWHRTALRLKEKGNHVIAGDFSNYDGSLLQDVMWKICDMINAWYDDGEENAQIRNVLFEEICNARVMVRGEIIQWTHSQPSGNPLTVIVNSLFNQIIMRYAFLLCKEKNCLPIICNFTEEVSMQTYGDDNVLNISENAVEWYNQITITEVLASVGLTYTDEGKTGQLISSRELDDVSYLKRKFKLDSMGYYSCPLDINVCYEMANWIRGKGGKGIAATMENGTASLRELYFHGEPVFNHALIKYNQIMSKHNPSVRFPSFNELKREYTDKYYC